MLFGDSMYAGIADSIEEYPAENEITKPLDRILPVFQQPHPWHRTAPFDRDFVLMCEFCELEGPKPLMTIPKDSAGKFDVNDFAVKVMAVDQTSSSEFAVTDDTQVVMSDTSVGIFSYVHHIQLFDVQARGFVRPFCMVYITCDQNKLIQYYTQMHEEFNKVSCFFKRNNTLLFLKDLEKHLMDIDYTREKALDYQLTNGQAEIWSVTFSEAELSTLKNQSVAALKDMYDEVLDVYQKLVKAGKVPPPASISGSNDSSELLKSESLDISAEGLPQLEPSCENRSLSNSSTSQNSVRLHRSVSNYKPRLVDLERKFEKRLRSLHELCGAGAKKGILRLHCIQKYFCRDVIELELEKSEASLMDPPTSLLTIGGCAQVNFLHNVDLTASERLSSDDIKANETSSSDSNSSQSPAVVSALSGFETYISLPPLFIKQRDGEKPGMIDVNSESHQNLPSSTPVFSFCDQELLDRDKCDENNAMSVCADKTMVIDSAGGEGGMKKWLIRSDSDQGVEYFCSACKAKVKVEQHIGMVINPGHYVKQISLNSSDSLTMKGGNVEDSGAIFDGVSFSLDVEDNYSLPLTGSYSGEVSKDVTKDGQDGSLRRSADDDDRLKTANSSTSYETAFQSDEFTSDESGTIFFDAKCENCTSYCSLATGSPLTFDTLQGKCYLDKASRLSSESYQTVVDSIVQSEADNVCVLCTRRRCGLAKGSNCWEGTDFGTADCCSDQHTNTERDSHDLTDADDKDVSSALSSSVQSGNWSVVNSTTTSSSHVPTLAPNTPGSGIVFLLHQYAHIEHVITSLLIGRPVVVVGNILSQQQILNVTTSLRLFLPRRSRCDGFPDKVIARPLRIVDLVGTQLIGLVRPERKCRNAIIPSSLKRYVTVLDIEKKVIVSPQYQNATVSTLLKNRKHFMSDAAFIAYFHSVMTQLGMKALVLYHRRDLSTSLKEKSCEKKGANYRQTLSKLMKILGVTQGDLKILLTMVEHMKQRQIDDHHLKTSIESELLVPPVRLEMENCQLFRC